jgi:hypothetical protein
MWVWALIWVGVLGYAAPLHAGVHYSAEKYAPLPSRWSGFLLDHRALRTIAVERPADGLVSPLRQEYLRAASHFQQLRRQRPLTAAEYADYGAVLLRLGRIPEAVAILQPAARRWPRDFHLQANLGAAWHLLGEWEQAAQTLQDAVSLAPPPWRRYEEYHLKLVQMRRAEKKGPINAVDNLLGLRFDGPAGMWPLDPRSLSPTDAAAIVQQLALWLPDDGRLLWLAAELAYTLGEVHVGATMLEGCIKEFRLTTQAVRQRHQLFRDAAQRFNRHELHRTLFQPRSTRPLVQAFNEELLPPPRKNGPTPLPWPLLQAAVIHPHTGIEFPKYLLRLEGQLVDVQGFLHPLAQHPHAQEFLLVPYPIGCWFCETPEPTSMIYVKLAAGRQVENTRSLMLVTGRLQLNRDNPETFLFTLEQAVVALPQ